MKEQIISIAKANGADLVGFAPASRFAKDDPIFRIYPATKTVICLAFRVLRGNYRSIEEGSTYYQYSTMGVENLEETVMPGASLRVANFIEANGYLAIPQRKNQTVMQEDDSTNPEIMYDQIKRGAKSENTMNYTESAILCGIGERGFHGALLTDEFGPMVRVCFVLTDAEIESDPVKEPHLCDGCGACVRACPGHAIDAVSGQLDDWQCAVYYNGANGLRNPFMPLDAYADFENRLEIIAGEAKVTPELARKIIDNTFFYPPISHSYTASICGRLCDIDCYCHLEEKGVLTKSFKEPFRKREKWSFSIEDFK